MAVISLEFALLVAIALPVHHALAPRWRTAWLLCVSYLFYCLAVWRFAPLLAAVTIVTFAVAGRLNGPGRRAWLWAGIAANAAALAVVRYLYRAEPFAGPFVVLGISFYSLQAISYLADLYSGRLKRAGSFSELALYLAYFPKLVAGPIERAHVFLPQLGRGHVVDDAVASRAFALIAVGLTRKLVLADPLAPLVPEQAFTDPGSLGALSLAGALIAYVFVLYNDFAGYTSIVRGVSSLFGIELSANFAQPFFARSFTEFWTRWHITLSLWLRDYIYLPLSRALLRRNPGLYNVPNIVLPPLTSMLASGLWHGASLHMLLWGALHGMYLVGERIVSLARRTVPVHQRPLWRQIAAALLVFVLGLFAFAAFRIPGDGMFVFWRRLLSGAPGPLPDARILLYVLPSLWLDWIQYRAGDEVAPFLGWSRLTRAAALATAMLLCFLMTRGGTPAPFVYQGF